MNPTERVRRAIATTKDRRPAYWEGCCEQRSAYSSEAAGSVYLLYPYQVGEAIEGATWEAYEHEAIGAGCVAFKTPLRGLVGIVALAKFADNAPVTLIDMKDTGFAEASVIDGRETNANTVIILGDDGKGNEIVYTFHPGAPIQPSKVPSHGNPRRTVTAREATSMGLVWAKVVTS